MATRRRATTPTSSACPSATTWPSSQVDGSRRLPHLDWFDGADHRRHSRCYAAGYPLGDPRVHADQGHRRQGRGRRRPHRHVVDRPHARARRQHPARQLGWPAASTSDGQVVGINYAGGARRPTTEQFFAIASDLAQPVVDQAAARRLRVARDQRLGRRTTTTAGISGIWVAGVAPGSPAADGRRAARRHRHVDERPARSAPTARSRTTAT